MILCSSIGYAQESELLRQYRAKVEEYNQDIKAAGHAAAIQMEKEKSTKADFLPSLSGNADFNYKGNPTELTLNRPGMEYPATVQGKDTRYGASLTLAQPLYSGGAIKAGHDKAKKENEMARHEQKRVTNNILYDADVHYWNTVAREEMVNVAEAFKQSVATLVNVVRDRVQEEYTDRTDLLMAEVKLNDAEYRLVQARNEAEVARLSMNSFSGEAFDTQIPTDSLVIPLKEDYTLAGSIETVADARPELQIAMNQVDIQKSAAKISNAEFLPKLSIGVDGSYSSPGYNFKTDLDPNYAVYAKLSVPIFEWGKRRNTRKSGKHSVNMAIENRNKVADNVRLEVKTSLYTYSQAVQKVSLTESSLAKAADSEKLALDKYKEGTISIVEVINAQLYHQEAKVNYIQSKLNAQIAKSDLDRVTGRMNAQ